MSSRSRTCDKAVGHLGRTQGTTSHLKNSDWDVSLAQTHQFPGGEVVAPQGCVSPQVGSAGRLGGTAGTHNQPPKVQPGACHCPQARAGSPAQVLGLSQPTWDSVSISSGVFFALVLPVPHCLGAPRRAVSVLASAGELWADARPFGRSWKSHHLELLSRLKMLPHAQLSSSCCLYGTEKPPAPLFFHATAPFPPSEG